MTLSQREIDLIAASENGRAAAVDGFDRVCPKTFATHEAALLHGFDADKQRAGKQIAACSETSKRPLALGDIIEICEIHQFEGTKWRAAIVISIHREAVCARLCSGYFCAPGIDTTWLPNHEFGRMWR